MQVVLSIDTLTPSQIFLFLLPVIVVFAAFVGDWWSNRGSRAVSRKGARR
jgi:hypothetical protein